MIPLRILNATRCLASTQNEYHKLWVRDEQPDQGPPIMVSAWELTEEDKTMLLRGGKVVLRVMGTVHPPVSVTVEPRE